MGSRCPSWNDGTDAHLDSPFALRPRVLVRPHAVCALVHPVRGSRLRVRHRTDCARSCNEAVYEISKWCADRMLRSSAFR